MRQEFDIDRPATVDLDQDMRIGLGEHQRPHNAAVILERPPRLNRVRRPPLGGHRGPARLGFTPEERVTGP